MKPAHSKIILAAWPVVCGLILGALIGGLARSWAIGIVVGGFAWISFLSVIRGKGDVENSFDTARVINPGDVPEAGDLQKDLALRDYGAVGMGPYAELYRQRDLD